MHNYQNILLAIDFSDDSHEVAQRAKFLAGQWNARLHVIHVLDNIPMPDTPYGTVISLEEGSSDDLLETEKNKFRQISGQFNIDPENRWLVWGEPRQEIIRIAAQARIDLIVVGSYDRHGLALLTGSTAKGVLSHAVCDVLAVHLKSS